MPTVNYLWIGLPPDAKHAGQDCIGPMLLNQKMPEQKVVFWCLNDFKSHYEQIFTDTEVTVCAIEDAILAEDSQLIEYITMIKGRVCALKEEGAVSKDIAREYISLKNVLAYYLQTKHKLYQDDDAYFLDTNVMPSPKSHARALPVLSSFSASHTRSQYDP